MTVRKEQKIVQGKEHTHDFSMFVLVLFGLVFRQFSVV